CDIFEREAVKSVAADAALLIAIRNGEAARRRPQTMVESGVETSDLPQRRPDRLDGVDRRETERLVQRRQRRQRFKLRVDIFRQFGRTGIVRAAVDDAMAYGT